MSEAEPQEFQAKAVPKLVNRIEELSWLMSRVPPQRNGSSFTILKAPSGYGKTRLTTHVVELLRAKGVLTVVLEPQIRAKKSAASVYQGFFTQRCAEALNQQIAQPNCKFQAPVLDDFLRAEWGRRAQSTNWVKFFRNIPSLKGAYELGVELFDRVFNTGDHSAGKLLTSDSREAVEACARYVKHIFRTNQVVLIVREAQHIDQGSLQLLSEIAGPHTTNSAILEYTLDDIGTLDPLYADFLEAAPLSDPGWLRIVELMRLSKPHLEELLRQTIPGARDISGEYYLHWDGNVRFVRQLQFSISVEHGVLNEPLLLDLKKGVVEEYQRQISRLDPTERMTLCLLFAHGEAIPKPILLPLLEKLNALATKIGVERCLANLGQSELVVAYPNATLGIENEDVAEAIRMQVSLGGSILLAKKVLRDHYRKILNEAKDLAPEVSLAVRQTLRLSVDLGDLATVEEIVGQLSHGVSTTTDQSWYVSQIVSAIGGADNFFAEQYDRLLLWAAQLSPEIADFQTAKDLLQRLSFRSSFADVLLCVCLIETGDHSEAEHFAEALSKEPNRDTKFAGQLIQVVLWRCTGRIEAARNLWLQLARQADLHISSLYGYLLRFKELIADFPECIDALKESSEWFFSRGLRTSAAYTNLTLASHLARTGSIDEAMAAVSEAGDWLAFSARDQHILLNNEVAVLLLSENPDAELCCDKLARAIPCSGDDYSDLVLYTNFAVAATLRGRNDLASEAVERALQIVNKPMFADRDVFWGVSFNLNYVETTLQLGRKQEIIALFGELRPHSLQNDYWQHRIGRSLSVPDRFRYMLSKPYHPMFLSHWILDVDGLQALKPEPSLAPPNNSSQSE